jgi:hypothetical protein
MDHEYNTNRQGGGVAIGIVKSLTFCDLSNTIPQLLREALELVFFQILYK